MKCNILSYSPGNWSHFVNKRKHVWFFAYKLRMERGTVLILTWLSAQWVFVDDTGLKR